MSQSITTAYHALDTSKQHNKRYNGVIRPGVYAGYWARANVGQPNLIDLTLGADTSSVLVTSEGVRIEETSPLFAVAAVAAADSSLTRIDLLVAEYQYTTDTTIEQSYKLIKGKNQTNLSADPIRPMVSNQFQVPLAWIMVRPQQATGGSVQAKVLSTDIIHVPKAAWAAAPADLSGLKPVIDPNDSRRVFVHEGVMPNVDGTRVISFTGGYSGVIDAVNLDDLEQRWYTIGVDDQGDVEVLGDAATRAALPELTSASIPVAHVRGQKIGGQLQLLELIDIRLTFSRQLSQEQESYTYRDLLAGSVFRYLRVEKFVDDALINLDTVQFAASGSSDDLMAEIDSSNTSLTLVWSGATSVPTEEVSIVTGNLLSATTISRVEHFMLAVDASFDNLEFRYSTSSATSGFSTTRHSPREIVRIQFNGATKLFIKFLVPVSGFVSGKARLFSYGALINLSGGVANAQTLGDLGLLALPNSVNNLIANGSFYYWSRQLANGTVPDLTSQDDLIFSLSSGDDYPLVADGWQMTKFQNPMAGEAASRVTRDQGDGTVATALELITAAATSAGSVSVMEYRIPVGAEIQGQYLTFAIGFETTTPQALGFGIAQYSRSSSGLVLKTKDEAFAQTASGETYVKSSTAIGPDTDQISFYVIMIASTSDVTHRLWDARAAVGEFSVLPMLKVLDAPGVLRQYYERGRIFSAQNVVENTQVGQAQQFGTPKAGSLGVIVGRTVPGPSTNRSSNVGDLIYSADRHGLLVTASASSAGIVTIDADWESFVKFEASVQ